MQSIVLGTSFIISDIKVSIDDAASSEAEAQVRCVDFGNKT